MVITRLPAEAQAKTGFTHVAKITFSDISTATTINVQALPVGVAVGPAVFHTLTAWNNTTPIFNFGVAAANTSNTGLSGVAAANAAGNVLSNYATVSQNTASRFLTFTLGTSGTAGAGEGYLWYRIFDAPTMTADPATA
jgi:hypothetical protein